MKYLLTTFRWIFGSIFTITGFIFLFSTPISGIVFLILGFFLLPFTLSFVEKRKKVSKGFKYTVPFVLFFLGSWIASEESIAAAKEKEYEEMVKQSQSLEFAEEVIANADDSTFQQYQKKNFDSLFIEDPELNDRFISLLSSNLHRRDSLIIEKERLKRIDSINKIAMEIEKRRTRRREMIEKQFSPWDGAHINLERLIEANMHNPDSYEHVQTTYYDKGDYLIVNTRYRGTNGFGAIITTNTKAKVSLEGTVLEVME